MDYFIPENLLSMLMISIVFSIILMTLIQKLKSLALVTKKWHILVINFICAFALGVPFGMTFYSLEIVESLWIGLFSFIGAPSIYEALKNQNLINLKPASLESYVTISKNNEIKRDDIT